MKFVYPHCFWSQLRINTALQDGGSILLEFNAKLEHCSISFFGNRAEDGMGAAIYTSAISIVDFRDSSNVIFNNNSVS